jgi:putative transposase
MLQAESAGLARSNGARGMAVASSRQRYRPPPADLVVQPIISCVDQQKLVPARHRRCRMTASLRASATFAWHRQLGERRFAMAGGSGYPARMTMLAPNRYAGHRFPPEIISDAVWLYFRFPLSLRTVEEMLAARGKEGSPVSGRAPSAQGTEQPGRKLAPAHPTARAPDEAVQVREAGAAIPGSARADQQPLSSQSL